MALSIYGIVLKVLNPASTVSLMFSSYRPIHQNLHMRDMPISLIDEGFEAPFHYFIHSDLAGDHRPGINFS